ncbi:MAG: diphthamide biosynthesis enzyme Dph2 [Euryarchaeota archaeon CG01_land_8_20_14_3_00_38_12]|nr:MAG: diphthamide biosynthesis enzyme Dph2 [Euryarchaeota archaeon CG01_land_8_20_14_3_00_38_12]
MKSMSEYDFELNKICKIINEKKYRKIMVQIPEGLKIYHEKIVSTIENGTDAVVILSGEPCYGACDINEGDADFLVHFGHSMITEPGIPYFFAECRSNIDVLKVVEKSEGYLEKNVGVLTTVQHINKIGEIKDILEKKGKNVFVGKGGKRIRYPGQVLGCDFSSALSIMDKVDCYLYVGTGNFHPLGVSIATKKKVIAADPYSNEISGLEGLKEKILRQRYAAIEKAKQGERFGIVVGGKTGQKRLGTAEKLKEMLEKNGKNAHLISLNEIKPEYLLYLNYDCFVCTACPRIAIDDYSMYEKPVLTPVEIEILLGKRRFEDYVFDQIE